MTFTSVVVVTQSLTALPLTSTVIDASLLRIPVEPTTMSGLRETSHVMIDRITAVRRTNVHERVGWLTAHQLVEVERAMLTFLGLAA